MAATNHCNNRIDIMDRPTSESSTTMLQTRSEFHRLVDNNNNNNSNMTNMNVSGTNLTRRYTGRGTRRNIVTTNDLRFMNARPTSHPYTRLVFVTLLPSLTLLVIIPIQGIVKEISTTSSDDMNSHSIVPMITMLSLLSINYFYISVLCIHTIFKCIIHIYHSSETNTADDVEYGRNEQQSNTISNPTQRPDGMITSNNERSGTYYATPIGYPENLRRMAFWPVLMFLCFIVQIPMDKDSATAYNIVTCVGYGFFSVSLMVGIFYLSRHRFLQKQGQQQEYYQQHQENQPGTIEIGTMNNNNDNKPIPESLLDSSTGHDEETNMVNNRHYYDIRQLKMKYIFLSKLLLFSIIFVILQQTLGIVIDIIDGTTITTGTILYCILMVFSSSCVILILIADRYT